VAGHRSGLGEVKRCPYLLRVHTGRTGEDSNQRCPMEPRCGDAGLLPIRRCIGSAATAPAAGNHASQPFTLPIQL